MFLLPGPARAQNAQILIVNHALFFSDLALRRQGASILPDYEVVVFDEAHSLENIAGDHLGLSVSSSQVDYLLNKLYNDRTNRGLLVHHKLREAEQAVTDCRFRADDFFAEVQQAAAHASNGRIQRAGNRSQRTQPGLAQTRQVGQTSRRQLA